MRERQFTALDLVRERQGLSPGQAEALNEKLLQYLRDNRIVPDQETFRQAAEVIADALGRGIAEVAEPGESAYRISPNRIKRAVNLGLGQRERIVLEAGNLIAESALGRGFRRDIDPVGPYAISRVLLEAAKGEVKNSTLSPSLENSETLLTRVEKRKQLTHELCTSYLEDILDTGMVADTSLEELLERVSTVEDKARIVRGGILASFFDLDTPAILVSDQVQEALDRYQKSGGIRSKKIQFAKSDLLRRFSPGLAHSVGQEEVGRFVEDLTGQNKSILKNWFLLLETSTGLDRESYEYRIRLSSFFEAYLPILLPGLEQPIIVDVEKIDMARDRGLPTLWDEQNSVVINGFRIPAPDILAIARRQFRGIAGTFMWEGRTSTPVSRALGAWRKHDRMIEEGPEIVAKTEQRVRELEGEYERIRGAVQIPESVINSYRWIPGDAEKYKLFSRLGSLRKRASELQRWQRVNSEKMQELIPMRAWLRTAGPQDEYPQVAPRTEERKRFWQRVDYLERRLRERREVIGKHREVLESKRLTPKQGIRRQGLLELAQRRIPEIEVALAEARGKLKQLETGEQDTVIVRLSRKEVNSEIRRLAIYTITPEQLRRIQGIGVVRQAARFIHGPFAKRFVDGSIPEPGEYDEWKERIVRRTASEKEREDFLWVASQMERDGAMFPTQGLEGMPWRTYRSRMEVRVRAANALVPAEYIGPQLREAEKEVMRRAKRFYLKKLEGRLERAKDSLNEKRNIGNYARRMLLETMQKLNLALRARRDSNPQPPRPKRGALVR